MPADVRMSGFRSRSTVEHALTYVDAHTARVPPASEVIPIEQSCGRVLSQEIRSTINVPSFDRSAMDGYAVRAEETTGASDYNPLPFALAGVSMPGQAFTGQLQSGEAVRIMTGAPLPEGADAVVPAEYARIEDDTVELTLAVGPLKHIGQTGEDIGEGDSVFAAGRQLRPQDVGVLASLGYTEVSVRPRPRVRLVITGNELALPGEPRGAHQIYEANSYMLRGLIARDGGELEQPLSRVPDTSSDIQNALTATGVDVILISGGTSVGAEDFAPLLVAELGELGVHGIAMRPSSPTGLGMVGDAFICLLPGNPVSCLCAYEFFAGRAIRTLAGYSAEWPQRKITGVLARKVVSSIGRVDHCRVTIVTDQTGVQQVTPLAISGASILSSTTRADGFLIVPESSEGMAPGQTVEVFLY